jgi:tryptophan synthase alpha subunit
MENASGAIVGSKFIQLLGEKTNPDDAVTGLLHILNVETRFNSIFASQKT